MKALLDLDGENMAVRNFLMFYGGNRGITTKSMRYAMTMSGFDGAWPEWANDDMHLTKAGAQLWLRHLFDLEKNVDTSEKHVHESDANVHVTPITDMPPTFQAYVRKGLADGTLQIMGVVNAS
jgi:hypothetical protein